MEQIEIETYMQMALAEAQQAAALGEVPIGAIVVKNGRVIGRGHNLREQAQDATSHAELLAIQDACRTIKSWRLEEAALFVTLEPCPMCSGAIINARIGAVYYGASDPKAGTAGTFMNLLTDTRFNHQAAVYPGILATESQAQLRAFFRAIRAKQKAAKKLRQQG